MNPRSTGIVVYEELVMSSFPLQKTLSLIVTLKHIRQERSNNTLKEIMQDWTLEF